MEEPHKALGQRLRALREGAGLTQEELAARLHVTRQTVSGWECGRSEPDLASLRQLAGHFGQTVDALLTDPPQPPPRRYRRGGLFMLPFVSLGLLIALLAGAPWMALASIALCGYGMAAVLILLGNRAVNKEKSSRQL